MSRFTPRSLRIQLALFGFAAIIVPVVVLLAVVFATVEVSEIDDDVAVHQTDGEPTIIEVDQTVVSVSDPTVSPWVPLTAVMLAIPAAAAVWIWSGRAVRPIKEITSVANQIQAGSLDQRIGLDGAPAEVQSLSESFDAMLDRLSAASTTQQQLIEDANHELRTPLAALAINSEVLLSAPNPSPDDYRSSALRTKALAQRMELTIDDLFKDARSRHLRMRQVDNDLVEVVRRVVEQQATMTPDHRVSWSGPAALPLGIDGPSVERAIRNLVDNAVHHSPPGTRVDVHIAQHDGIVTVAVTDEGPGIAPELHDHIFERYFRVGEADHDLGQGSTAEGRDVEHSDVEGSAGQGRDVEGRDVQGSTDQGSTGQGIGLAIVKQVADAHGGVTVESPVADGRGSRFTLTFDA